MMDIKMEDGESPSEDFEAPGWVEVYFKTEDENDSEDKENLQFPCSVINEIKQEIKIEPKFYPESEQLQIPSANSDYQNISVENSTVDFTDFSTFSGCENSTNDTTYSNENPQILIDGVNCSDCSFSSERKTDNHTVEKPFNCTLCSYSTSQKFALTLHERSHENYRYIRKCSQCPFFTIHKFCQIDHELKHSKPKYFKCLKCSYFGCSEEALSKHEQSAAHFSEDFIAFIGGRASLPTGSVAPTHGDVLRFLYYCATNTFTGRTLPHNRVVKTLKDTYSSCSDSHQTLVRRLKKVREQATKDSVLKSLEKRRKKQEELEQNIFITLPTPRMDDLETDQVHYNNASSSHLSLQGNLPLSAKGKSDSLVPQTKVAHDQTSVSKNSKSKLFKCTKCSFFSSEEKALLDHKTGAHSSGHYLTFIGGRSPLPTGSLPTCGDVLRFLSYCSTPTLSGSLLLNHVAQTILDTYRSCSDSRGNLVKRLKKAREQAINYSMLRNIENRERRKKELEQKIFIKLSTSQTDDIKVEVYHDAQIVIPEDSKFHVHPQKTELDCHTALTSTLTTDAETPKTSSTYQTDLISYSSTSQSDIQGYNMRTRKRKRSVSAVSDDEIESAESADDCNDSDFDPNL